MKATVGLLILICGFSVGSPLVSGKLIERPNIILILADDLAWNDLGSYGARQIVTPHLDHLAAEGASFSQAYAAAPICSASRAAILTGRSPARLGLEFVTKNPGAIVRADDLPLRPPSFTRHLPLEEVTFAERLGRGGYRTGFYGKWHVAEHNGRYLGWSNTHGPRQQGFDEAEEDFGGHSYGTLATAPTSGPDGIESGRFPTDSMTEKAIQFLERNQKRPFCLEVAHFFVHDPLKAPSRWLFERARKRTGVGSDEAAAHIAMVETLDHHVGQLLGAVDRLRLRDNTLIIFTSDNGGAPGLLSRAPLRGSKWSLYEAGLRVPLIVRWPGKIRAGKVIRAATIATDLFPSLLAAAGVEIGGAIKLDGLNLLPALFGQSTAYLERRALYWHFPYYIPEPPKVGVRRSIGIDPPANTLFTPASAIRSGRYKLVRNYESGRDELFNLTNDPGEENDLARIEPSQLRILRRKLDLFLKESAARYPEVNTETKK